MFCKLFGHKFRIPATPHNRYNGLIASNMLYRMRCVRCGKKPVEY